MRCQKKFWLKAWLRRGIYRQHETPWLSTIIFVVNIASQIKVVIS